MDSVVPDLEPEREYNRFVHGLLSSLNMTYHQLMVIERYGAALPDEQQQLLAYAIDMLREIELNVVRRSALVNRISPEPVSLAQIHSEFERVFERVRRSARWLDRDEVELALRVAQIAPDCADVDMNVDLIALRAVFACIVENFVHYGATAQAPILSLRAEVQRNAVRLVIADEGPGIAAGERELIFEERFRGGAARRRHPAGTGAGLYDARRLLRRMGGDLQLADGAHGAAFACSLARSAR
ncbi:MAG: ATP-binding protein [Conexibacter sp.]